VLFTVQLKLWKVDETERGGKKNDGNGGRIELTNNYIVSEDAGSTFLVHMGLENVN
jgi:hypothetical protein